MILDLVNIFISRKIDTNALSICSEKIFFVQYNTEIVKGILSRAKKSVFAFESHSK